MQNFDLKVKCKQVLLDFKCEKSLELSFTDNQSNTVWFQGTIKRIWLQNSDETLVTMIMNVTLEV